jgi:hypothetical protein
VTARKTKNRSSSTDSEVVGGVEADAQGVPEDLALGERARAAAAPVETDDNTAASEPVARFFPGVRPVAMKAVSEMQRMRACPHRHARIRC